ncbi:MAG: cytochrome P450 [Acidimicrobiales bacterium]|jgi:cytochrome P450 family 142 subfamily A polypeptide 1|nr:cytochrome P450 [Acidimicrobiales bacterium]
MTVIDPAHIDVLDPELYQGDPYPVYAWLRENDPVHWDPKNELWVISRFADVMQVSLHNEIFCSGQGVRPKQDYDLSLIGLDEPRHLQQRRLINRGFTPRAIRALEPHLREIVTETLDAVAHRGECDFVADIAVPVPIVIIAELMGLPVEDRHRLWKWSDAMMLASAVDDPADPAMAAGAQAFVEYTTYLTGMLETRRALLAEHQRAVEAGAEAAPLPDDLVMKLVTASAEGVLAEDQDIHHDELLGFLVLLVVAGNETTRNAMSGAMKVLSDHPDQWRRLVEDPSLFDTAVDEMIRWVSPVMNFTRTATRDTDMLGPLIREGEKVLMLYQSANRDPEHFDRPDEFLVDRSPNDHLAFGIGNHFCLGIHLARLEVRTVFEEIARRFPDMRVREGAEPVYSRANFVRGVESLPVVFTPES